MGKMKGNSATPYVDYHLSFHLGFCCGPVDTLEAVWMKDKLVFEDTMYGGNMKFVDEPELFGGQQREGGVRGNIHFLDGGWTQTVPAPLAARLGLAVNDCPGYRGVTGLVFLGTDNSSGFKVSSNYPNVPPVKARFKRGSWTLGSQYAIIPNTEFDRDDSNPAHIIYECLVDSIWGMGGSPNLISTDSFIQAAETLYNEGFGLSFKWMRQTTIEAFLQEVLDHINGMFFFNPRTGLGQLKLLRDDYDVDELVEIGPSNSRLLNFRRKLWGETVNEIIVSWTNPETEEEETITYQSLGNIAMQGEVVSEQRNYYGVRSRSLANTLCARDIVSASFPLAVATIEVDRRQWKILPGDVIKFSWPVDGYNIGMILMRVMDVDYGQPDDSKMKLELMEDVFGLDSAEFFTPPPSEWVDPEQDPNEPGYTFPTHFAAAPYPVIQSLPFYEPDDDDYPQIVVAVMSTPEAGQYDLQKIIVWKKGYLPNGDETWISVGERNLTATATVIGPMPAEVSTHVEFQNFSGGGQGPTVAGFVLISDQDEFGAELAMINSYVGGGVWELSRGILDTVPKNWSAGTKVWFIGPDFYAFDWSEPMADEVIDYRIQARTSKGVRDLDLVSINYTQHPARHYFPFRPANFKVDGVAFGSSSDEDNHNPRQWQLPVTWSNRHRKTEDGIVRKWDEGTTAPEPGQTTVLEINETYRIEGLEGTAHNIPIIETGRIVNFNIKGLSHRDGFDSLQGHTVNKRIYPKGYGCDYGYFFGGWPQEPGDMS